MNLLTESQDDMRVGYYSGATGVLASGLAWSVAAASVVLLSPQQAVWVLFGGGVLIYPVSLVICKLLGARGEHAKGNPLASLAMANTFWMLMCFPLAFAAQMQRIEWFFPAMLLIIGGRYLTFALMYGMRAYWLLGFALAAVGFVSGYLSLAPIIPAAAGAAVELAFAVALLVTHARWAQGRVQASAE